MSDRQARRSGARAGSQAVRRPALAPGSPRRAATAVSSLVRLAHHRWSIPVLAALGPRGARISELAHRLGGSRAAVRQAAEALVRMGLVAPVGGHGHPLRPEVSLTEAGERVAEVARRLEEAVERTGAGELARRKWTLPVLLAIGERPSRYGEVRRALGSVTDRALSAALRDLERAGLASREVLEHTPPATRYRLVTAALEVASAAKELLAALGSPGAPRDPGS